MTFSKESAVQQSVDLLPQYPQLEISFLDESKLELSGSILVNREARGYRIYNAYQIKIVVPLISKELPYVLDVGRHICENYSHRYPDGKLCLETDTHVRIRFIDGFSLAQWITEYVEPYFFSYEFYQRYGEYPFGERGHGLDGILQTYSDVFFEPDIIKVFKLITFIANNEYRGHVLCPCGSGTKLRSCHGQYLIKYYLDKRLHTIVKEDYFIFEEAINEYNRQRDNSGKAK